MLQIHDHVLQLKWHLKYTHHYGCCTRLPQGDLPFLRSLTGGRTSTSMPLVAQLSGPHPFSFGAADPSKSTSFEQAASLHAATIKRWLDSNPDIDFQLQPGPVAVRQPGPAVNDMECSALSNESHRPRNQTEPAVCSCAHVVSCVADDSKYTGPSPFAVARGASTALLDSS